MTDAELVQAFRKALPNPWLPESLYPCVVTAENGAVRRFALQKTERGNIMAYLPCRSEKNDFRYIRRYHVSRTRKKRR